MFFYHVHNGFACSICRFSCIRKFVVFACVHGSSEDIQIHLYVVSVRETVMTGIRIFCLYVVNITFSLFFIFDMKNIPDKSWSFDLGYFEFAILYYGFVEEFCQKDWKELKDWKVQRYKGRKWGKWRKNIISLYFICIKYPFDVRKISWNLNFSMRLYVLPYYLQNLSRLMVFLIRFRHRWYNLLCLLYLLECFLFL